MLNKLLSGEIKDWPQIQALGNLYQDYMVGGIEKLFPNFSDILSQGGIDTQNLLESAEPLTRGEIPDDVKSAVLRSGAFQNLMGGGGDAFLGSLQARDLGQTSLDLMKQGASLLGEAGNAAQRWSGLASGTMMNPGSQLYSPEWFSNFMAGQNAAKQATQQMKFNVDAAPDPAWADRAKLFANIVGMAAGGMGGGAGNAATGSYASNFGGMMGGGGGGDGMSYNQFAMNSGFPQQNNFGYGQNLNPGFASNFSTAAAGGPPQGVGGWFGSFFNQGGY